MDMSANALDINFMSVLLTDELVDFAVDVFAAVYMIVVLAAVVAWETIVSASGTKDLRAAVVIDVLAGIVIGVGIKVLPIDVDTNI